MEPAPLSADEIDEQIASVDGASDLSRPHEQQVGDQIGDDVGEDVEPPYLRLRTLIDESAVKDADGAYTPELDLTEFAVVAENTGVEILRHDPPPFQRTLVAAVEPTTATVVPPRSRLSLSRSRLVGWGALAFCAGLVASAGAHMLAAPAPLGATANAASATVATATTTAATAVPVPPLVATPAAASVAVAAPMPAAAVAKQVAAPTPSDTAQLTLAAGTPAAVRTRSGAASQSRAQTRARGKSRPLPRGESTATATASADAKPAATSDGDTSPAPTARPAAHRAANWVDPFAE